MPSSARVFYEFLRCVDSTEKGKPTKTMSSRAINQKMNLFPYIKCEIERAEGEKDGERGNHRRSTRTILHEKRSPKQKKEVNNIRNN